MSNLEMTVEALKRCVPKDAFDKAMAELETLAPPHAPRKDATKMIHATLKTLGMPTHIIGYRYVVFAIQCLINDPDMAKTITKGLYVAVADKFGTTKNRAERGVRHAIEVTWERGDLTTLDEFFGSTVSADKGKPTNSEFITCIATQIRLELGEAF